jgi:FkbM family methyltransferase
MGNYIKKKLYEKYPEFHTASEFYSIAREVRRSEFQTTPHNFKIKGLKGIDLGNYDIHETKIIKHFLTDSDIFVDVGANVGYYTCMAMAMGKHVISIEPLFRNLEHLYVNLKANGWQDNIEIYPVGLSSKPGLATLYGIEQAASLIRDWAGTSTKQRTIPLTTLDIILSGRFYGKKILIKVDVEGAEHDILIGAEKALKTSPSPLWFIEIYLTEYHPEGINKNFSDTFDIFLSHNYEAYTIIDGNLRVLSQTDISCILKSLNNRNFGCNFVFKKKNA